MSRVRASIGLLGRHGPYVVANIRDGKGGEVDALLDPASAITLNGRTWRPYIDDFRRLDARIDVDCDGANSRVLADGHVRIRIADPAPNATRLSIHALIDTIPDEVDGPLPEGSTRAASLCRDAARTGHGLAIAAPGTILDAVRGNGRIKAANGPCWLSNPQWKANSDRTVLSFESDLLEDHHLAEVGGYAALAETLRVAPREAHETLARLIGRSGDTVVTWLSGHSALICSPVLTGCRILDASQAPPSVRATVEASPGLRLWMVGGADVTVREGTLDASVTIVPETRQGDPFQRMGIDKPSFLLELAEAIGGDGGEAGRALAAAMEVMDDKRNPRTTPRKTT